MSKIRILIVDDSVVIRKLVSDILSDDPALEVIGTARNGRLALAKIEQTPPDLVTLDIEMPELNGLETLVEIRKIYPKLPVIMFSSLTERGAQATLEALTLGANDYVTKPSKVGEMKVAMQRIREQLVPKIKAFFPRYKTQNTSMMIGTEIKPVVKIRKKVFKKERIDILAIGASTGGPNALAALLTKLPKDFPVPIVIVQHMPPVFTKLLAQRLEKKCEISVEEGKAGGLLKPGHAWIAPGNFHMTVSRRQTEYIIQTNQKPPENSCRPSVDVLLRSVSQYYGANTLTVILTGMGQDGYRGCEKLQDQGSQILVQDKGSSVVWGMPGAVAKANLADKILPLDQLSGEIIQRVKFGRSAGKVYSLK